MSHGINQFLLYIIIFLNNINRSSSDSEYLGSSTKHLFHFVQVISVLNEIENRSHSYRSQIFMWHMLVTKIESNNSNNFVMILLKI